MVRVVWCLSLQVLIFNCDVISFRNFLQLVFSGDNTGRVLKYDPIAKKAVVLVSNLQFPNGVSISKDGSFFVFCEGDIGR